MAEVETGREGGVLTITLNRPEVLNALTRETQKQLVGALKEARADDVRAVVLTGAGRGFCVGQDLTEFREGADDISERLRANYHPTVLAIRSLEKPVIAAVNGAAAGAGLSLACVCDLRIAADSATFVPAFINIGLVPDGGGTYFISRLLGPARAFEWMSSGRRLSAAEAHAWGLVSEVVEGDQFAERAAELAETYAQLPTARYRDDEAALRPHAARDSRGAARVGSPAAGGGDEDRGLCEKASRPSSRSATLASPVVSSLRRPPCPALRPPVWPERSRGPTP